MKEEERRAEPLPDTYNVTLPNFEGPLDLLLHLCQKHELDILEIPISFVTEKYLQYLSVMKLMNLDVAAEYLVMAATLMHIKSKSLLPAPPPGQEDDLSEEEQDPREALIKRLLEYQKYKNAAADLVGRGITGADIFYRGSKAEEAVDTGPAPLAPVPLFSLVEAFQHVLSKAKVQFTHDVIADRISLTDRMQELTLVLQVRRRIVFEELFEGLTTRFDLVITFLALLEMCRDHIVRLYQTEPLAPLYLESTLLGEDDEASPDTSNVTEAGATPSGSAVPPTLRTGEPLREQAHYPAPALLDEEPLPSLFDETFPDLDDSRSSMIIEAAAVVDGGFTDDVFPGEPSVPEPSSVLDEGPPSSSVDVTSADRSSVVLETSPWRFHADDGGRDTLEDGLTPSGSTESALDGNEIPFFERDDAASGEIARVSMVRDVNAGSEELPAASPVVDTGVASEEVGSASGEIAVGTPLSSGQPPTWGRANEDPAEDEDAESEPPPSEGAPSTNVSAKAPEGAAVGDTDPSGTGLAKPAPEAEPEEAIDPPEETA